MEVWGEGVVSDVEDEDSDQTTSFARANLKHSIGEAKVKVNLYGTRLRMGWEARKQTTKGWEART